MTAHERRIEVEIEVPATPEQAWEAIATGPGISAWFMPAEVEGRVGGSVTHRHDGETTAAGTVVAHEPPHRFGYTEEWLPGEPPLATEFLVEARSGGTCVVRVVMSGLGDGEEWDRAIESFRGGWSQALLSLRLYLAHFAGEPAASLVASDIAAEDGDAVWERLVARLGLPSRPPVGARVATTATGAPTLAGTVAGSDERMLTIRLEEPGSGIGFVGVGGPGEGEVFAFVRVQLFGPEREAVAAREREAWRSWFAGERDGTGVRQSPVGTPPPGR